MINGVTQIVMTKADVLDEFETIRACVAYRSGSEETANMPFRLPDNLEPVYRSFEGWKTSTAAFKEYADLQLVMKEYVRFLENFLKAPVRYISNGPGRDQLIRQS